MRFKNIKFIHIVILLTLVSVTAVGIRVSSAAGSEPGTSADPVVSQSYVDSKVSDLNAQISDLKLQLQSAGQGGTTVQPAASKFQVVGPVSAGKKIVCGESTEIVLRSGAASAIASQYGGVADLISGTDLKTDENVSVNHLLLIPRDDGRGIKVTTEAWVLVRGTYTIN
jgi:hypothetical protein